MTLNNFLSSCRSPQIIENARGEIIKVPCGKCADCTLKKNRYYESLLNIERSHSHYTYFITLTYDENYVPLVSCNYTNNQIVFKDFCPRSDSYGKVISTFYPSEGQTYESFKQSFEDFYKKTIINSAQHDIYQGKQYIRRLLKSDVQDFLKRFRWYLSTILDLQVRFFAVGEYGPKHYRPHYHLLLFSSRQLTIPFLQEYVCKSWRFGTSLVKPTDDRKHISSYLSSYCTNTSLLPCFLRVKQLKDFQTHSRFLGQQNLQIIRNYVYMDDRRATEEQSITIDNKIVPYFPTSQTITTLYPRCYNFYAQDITTSTKLLLIYSRLARAIGIQSPSFLARYFCEWYDYKGESSDYFKMNVKPIIREYMGLLELNTSDFPSSAIFSCEFFGKSPTDYSDNVKKYYNRILNALYTSKHFLTFCCNLTVDNILHYTDKSLWEIILPYRDKIYNFYHFIYPQTLLKRQYESQIEFLKRYAIPDDDDETFFDIFYPIESEQLLKDKGLYPVNSNYLATLRERDKILMRHPFIQKTFLTNDQIIKKNSKTKFINDSHSLF